MEDQEQPSLHLSGTTRLEAFSDGIFGIALTLLVLGFFALSLRQRRNVPSQTS